MPEGSDPLAHAITRRQGMIALAVLGPLGLLAACSSAGDAGPPSGTGAPTSPADDVATGAAADEQAMIARYDSVLATWPDLDPAAVALLTTIRAEHVQHREALGVAVPPTSLPPSDARSATSDSVLRDLAHAERKASKSRIQACLAAQTPELARLLAFIGASEAAHAPALRDVDA